MQVINLVFEDALSEFVLLKLLHEFGNKYIHGVSYNSHGFGNIKSKINGFNEACITVPFLVLTDLDNVDCPVILIDSWFAKPIHANMIFRIAVREVESWLLADIEGMANYLGIPENRFTANPELLQDPKLMLMQLVRKSRRGGLKKDILPINNNASIGPNYNGRLMEFVENYYNIGRARERSESLNRAYIKLESFHYTAP